MDEKQLVSELNKAQTVDDVLAIAEQAGKPLTYEQADKVFGHVLQTKSDTAELDGDTLPAFAKEYFGI